MNRRFLAIPPARMPAALSTADKYLATGRVFRRRAVRMADLTGADPNRRALAAAKYGRVDALDAVVRDGGAMVLSPGFLLGDMTFIMPTYHRRLESGWRYLLSLAIGNGHRCVLRWVVARQRQLRAPVQLPIDAFVAAARGGHLWLLRRMRWLTFRSLGRADAFHGTWVRVVAAAVRAGVPAILGWTLRHLDPDDAHFDWRGMNSLLLIAIESGHPRAVDAIIDNIDERWPSWRASRPMLKHIADGCRREIIENARWHLIEPLTDRGLWLATCLGTPYELFGAPDLHRSAALVRFADGFSLRPLPAGLFIVGAKVIDLDFYWPMMQLSKDERDLVRLRWFVRRLDAAELNVFLGHATPTRYLRVAHSAWYAERTRASSAAEPSRLRTFLRRLVARVV